MSEEKKPKTYFGLKRGEMSKRARKEGISHQAMHQRMRVKAGLCHICGGPRGTDRMDKVVCLRCSRERSARNRKQNDRRTTRCGNCKRRGHNARTCQKVAARSARETVPTPADQG